MDGRGPTAGRAPVGTFNMIDPASGAVVIDAFGKNLVHYHLKLTGNVSLTFANFRDGTLLWVMFEQDAVGGRTVSGWPSGSRMETAVSVAANAFDSFHLGWMMGKFHQHAIKLNLPTV